MSADLELTTASPCILHFDCGGCGGCALEQERWVRALSDAQRLRAGRRALLRGPGVLVVTGAPLDRNRAELYRTYRHAPRPLVVLALGACALSGGVFCGGYGVVGGADNVIPVDVCAPGCPPAPGTILGALFLCLSRFSGKEPAPLTSTPSA